MSLRSLFDRFDALLFLDTETTGFSPWKEEIIELGFIRLDGSGAEAETDHLIRLSPGRTLPWRITELTGITGAMLEGRGVEKPLAAAALADALDGAERPLLAAYNAQFDLCFLWYFLAREGREDCLRRASFLDVMTVYKDRRDYPHRLSSAVEAYGVDAVNSHRACDDARAAMEVLKAMGGERDDLDRYVNLFGYDPRYGPPKPRIRSVRYAPQPYDRRAPLYDTQGY